MGELTARRVTAFAGVLLGALALACVALPQSPLRAVIVAGESMEPTLENGDVVLAWRRHDYRPGDVVAFRIPSGEPGAGALVIHRIVGGDAAAGYVLRGDNRDADDLWRPRPSDVAGTAVLRIPKVGLLPGLLRTPFGLALAGALFTISLLLGGSRRKSPVRASGS